MHRELPEITCIAPKGKPKAIVQILHGANEYRQRYIQFMGFLAKHGYLCVIHNHRGHGSVKGLGDLPEKAGEKYVLDVVAVTNHVKELHPDLDVILIGHSMGALITRVYMKYFDSKLAGVILIGCPSRQLLTPIATVGMLGLKRLLGGDFKSWLLSDICRFYDWKYTLKGRRFGWVCANEDVVVEFNNDVLCHFDYNINGYLAMLWLMWNAYDMHNWVVANCELPVVCLSGEDDVCTGSKKDINVGLDTLWDVGYHYVISKRYAGLKHDILHEGVEEVFDDILKVLGTIVEERGNV